MSKKKNTLNDLEEFLKLQASTLVPPQPVETSQPVEQPKVSEPVIENPIITPVPVQTIAQAEVPKAIDLLDSLKQLAVHNKKDFYDHIIQAVETMPTGSNDVLLINTALYLKHGDHWKAGIEEYWKKRKSQSSH